MENISMSATMMQPLLGLDIEFPNKVTLLKHPSTEQYWCLAFDGDHGVVCFSDDTLANAVSEKFGLKPHVHKTVTFDEAREIARQRSDPRIVCLLLLDEPNKVQKHYIR